MMETEEAQSDSDALIAGADRIRISRAQDTGIGDIPKPGAKDLEDFSFAEPTDLSAMRDYFGLSADQMLDSSVIGKLRTINDMAEMAEMPVDEFMMEVGTKVGGRFSPGFLDKTFAYVKALHNEARLKRRLELQQKELDSYEGSDHLR